MPKKIVASCFGIVLVLAIFGIVVFQGRSTGQTSSSQQTASTRGASTPGKSYIASEVAKNNSPDSCWLIINGQVYDVTQFLNQHPGGSSMIVKYCGKDATKAFETQDRGFRGGHSSSAKQMLGDYLIGTLVTN